MRLHLLLFLFLVLLACQTPVLAQAPAAAPEPAVFLNFEEGSGMYALDGSGHGNAAALHNVSRIESGACSRALVFSNPDSYVSIPYRVLNHPADHITVSAWFYADNITPAPLVSAYHDGGYRLGFDDGNDLWWTVNLGNTGDVSVPVRHENIAPGQWHQVTGTYDGYTVKIYLDGILRNQVNATGAIQYANENYIILGADAGPSDAPGPCPRYFTGGLDEVRIYPAALSYSQVMDDRYRCSGENRPPAGIPAKTAPQTCEPVSGSVRLGANETAVRVLSFGDKTVNGTWQVSLQPGSLLRVHAYDSYMKASPDEWYLEIADDSGKPPARTIAFPARNNAPAEAMLPSGNGTVTVRYFGGDERFPATVRILLESLPPVPPRQAEPENILKNPIIVIYSASWATLVAILLVMIWLRWRKKGRKTETGEPVCRPEEDKKL